MATDTNTAENTTDNKPKEANSKMVDAMFKAGTHFAFTKARRHPTTSPYIFGVKNKIEIFNLEKLEPLLEEAKAAVKKLASEGKTILFVGGKSESRNAINHAGNTLSMPHVAGRWVGGTISNFPEIRKRIQKFLDLTSQKEKGELVKYTKRERLMIDREIEKLEKLFGGLVSLTKLPDAMFVVDARKEHIAVKEALDINIPVIAFCGSDNNIKDITYPIVGNDSSVTSVNYIVGEIIAAFKEGQKK